MSAQEKTRDELLPVDVARMALEACNGVQADAVPWAVEWMTQHSEWADQHRDIMARYWIAEHIRTEQKTREVSLRGGTKQLGQRCPDTNVIAFQNQLTETINANFSRMMDAPLWGGKRIGEATPAEIRESSEQFSTQGKTMMRKAMWQASVAAKAEENGCGVNEPVRTALTPKTFDELWEASHA